MAEKSDGATEKADVSCSHFRRREPILAGRNDKPARRHNSQAHRLIGAEIDRKQAPHKTALRASFINQPEREPMLVSPADVVARAKATIKECTVSQAKESITPQTLVIDIREPAEYARGHIPGAVLSPRGLLEFEIHGLVQRTATDPAIAPEDRDIVLYCGTGGRSALAAETLDRMGYRNVRSMDGGIVAWATARLPVDVPDD